MKLSQLVAKPQLIMITLDDPDTIKEHNEPVEFYTWDRQPMDIFMKLANATEGNVTGIITIVKELILDEHAKPILTGENMLPVSLLMRAIGKVTEALGK
jgi:hypothetical protein